MIKGVFFDLCGTLLIYGDMDAAWEEWLETGYACFKRTGLKYTREQFQQACDGIFSQPEPQPQKDGLTVYERRLKRLSQEIGHSMSQEDLQSTAMATVRTWADRLYLDPDCPAVLEALQKRFQLAVISNYDHPPYIEMVLQKNGLKAYFKEVLISSTVGLKKPDPAIFRLALRRTGLAASQVIHVGDSLEDDIKGAQSASIRPVFIQRDPGLKAAPADYRSQTPKSQVLLDNRQNVGVHTIRRLTELLDII
jgi:putative hydrolase of the HAD superfamily